MRKLPNSLKRKVISL